MWTIPVFRLHKDERFSSTVTSNLVPSIHPFFLPGTHPLITALILAACSLQAATAHADDHEDIINPDWKRPSLWRKRTRHGDGDADPGGVCECPPVPVCEPLPKETKEPPPAPAVVVQPVDENCNMGFAFYKKFLNRLFEEKSMEVGHESEFLVRNVQLRITRHQLDRLRAAKTAREIDGIISSVVEQSTESSFSSVRESICWSLVELAGQVSRNAYFLYVFIPTFGLLGIYWLVRVFSRLMHIHPLIVALLMVLLVSYAVTYQDCNRRLEAEAMVRFATNGGTNPCAESHEKGSESWIARLFGVSREAKCQEYLRNMMVTNTICDPSTVAVEMVAKLQLHYFDIFITKMLGVFKTSTANTSWFGSILITVFLCLIIYFLLTNCVKYGMYGSANFFAAYFTAPAQRQPAAIENHQVPATPITLNINLDPLGKLAALVGNNRIEEITDRTEPLQPLRERIEDGSGDAPSVPMLITNVEKKCEEGSDDKSGEVEKEVVADDDQRAETLGHSSTRVKDE